MTSPIAKVLYHPNFGGEPVINQRTPGRPKGVPTLAMARREKVAAELRRERGQSAGAYGRRYDAAKEVALHGSDGAVLAKVKALQVEAMGLFAKAMEIERAVVYRQDPELEKIGKRVN